MKAIPHASWKLLPSALTIALTGTAFSASLIDSGAFFDPDLRVRRPGATTGTILVALPDNNPIINSAANTLTDWTHSATGFTQLRSEIVLPLVSTTVLDAQIAGYTQTINDTLVFGREITASATIAGVPVIDPALNQLISDVAGADGLIYNWQSTVTATVPVVSGQQYRVSFEVTTGEGLSLDLLTSAGFGISEITGTQNGQLLNLIDILEFGGDRTGVFTFDFTSTEDRNSLEFFFNAADTAGANLLGGQAGNENVLTFSNFQMNAIPEPSSLVISAVAAGLFLLRRKRVA